MTRSDATSLGPSDSALPRMLSVVTPAFNEKDNLRALYDRLTETMRTMDLDWEWVVVDDHSTDGTFDAVEEIAARDSRARCLRLSRNFGSHAASACGIHHALGDCVVTLAADLQDPPEVVPDLVAQWSKGAPVVWAARRQRQGESRFYRLSARFYHRTMARMAGLHGLPSSGADFFLIDRIVVEAFKEFGERNVSNFALLAWMGFDHALVRYDRPARRHGTSRWSLSKRVKLFLDSVVAFSFLPIRIILWLGLTTAILGLIYAAVIVVNAFIGSPVPGWSSTMVVVLVLGGGQMIMISVIGEYVWRALDEARGRPRFVIERTTGSDRDMAADARRRRVHTL